MEYSSRRKRHDCRGLPGISCDFSSGDSNDDEDYDDCNNDGQLLNENPNNANTIKVIGLHDSHDH